ncbi:MAG: class II fructose-bisphosphatase [Anaerovoracaceae bacterium]|mgnify:CR=1 FL=1|nr:class II fructose-bisphosphatase [Anaerovoracaceae bacterium]
MNRIGRDLGLNLARVTEVAAIESAKWLGRGNKNAADQAAVNGMRRMFDTVDIDGTVVIGEGEKDEAPMLYIGEQIGQASEDAVAVDIAVDPLDGTTSTAKGLANAISVMAVAPKGALFHTDVFYMEKIAVGPKAKDVIDLSKPLKENLLGVAEALQKPIEELTVTIQERERHDGYVRQCRELGCRIKLFRDGDVGAAISTCMEDSGIDIMIGIGGAPEGVLAAAALKCLDGGMQARLSRYKMTPESKGFHEDFDKILTLDDLVRGDSVFFVATGVSDGDMVRGVRFLSNRIVKTHTVVMRGETGTIRFIEAIHNMNKKPDYAQV